MPLTCQSGQKYRRRPFATIPFSRNRDFVDRGDILEEPDRQAML